MQFLNGRQRIAAASMLKRRPELLRGMHAVLDDSAYKLWFEVVCSEMQRLGIVDPRQVKEFCERAGVATDAALPLEEAPPTAA